MEHDYDLTVADINTLFDGLEALQEKLENTVERFGSILKVMSKTMSRLDDQGFLKTLGEQKDEISMEQNLAVAEMREKKESYVIIKSKLIHMKDRLAVTRLIKTN